MHKIAQLSRFFFILDIACLVALAVAAQRN